MKRRREFLGVMAAVTVLVTGCGTSNPLGDGGPGDDSHKGISADTACEGEAAVSCAKLDMCITKGVTLRYGDMSTCVSRLKQACLNSLAAPKTGASTDSVSGCTSVIPGATCQDYLANRIAYCQPREGDLADGSPCAFAAQCKSTFCATAVGAPCGKCATPPQPGDSCAMNQCANGQYCNKVKTCQTFGVMGSPCDATANCALGYACAGATANASGTCVVAATMSGAMCERKGGPLCEFDAGLVCVTAAGMTTGTCMAYQYAMAGQACGFMNGGDTICTGGATCVGATLAKPGACVAPAADGAACDSSAGPFCQAPARCVTSGAGTAGICKVNDGASCTGS